MTDSETLNTDPVQSWIDEEWHLWQSDTGDHYAVRSNRPTATQTEDGYWLTLAADTPEDLRILLREQPDAPKGAAR